jgi:hypothetical protein
MADTVTVRVPLAIRKRGGRKVVVSPDGSVLLTAPRHMATNTDPALLKALGRAFRWRRLLDDGPMPPCPTSRGPKSWTGHTWATCCG